VMEGVFHSYYDWPGSSVSFSFLSIICLIFGLAEVTSKSSIQHHTFLFFYFF